MLSATVLLTIGGGLAAAPAAAAAEAATTVVIADFEKDLDGFKGKMARDAAEAKSGKAAAKMEADFAKAGPWITATKPLEFANEIKQLRFYVRSGDAKGLTLRLVDFTGQNHQQRPTFPPDGQWHLITISTFDSGQGYEKFGGAADGRFHWPAKSISFIFEKGNVAPKTQGTLWIDGVEATIDPKPYVPDLQMEDQARLGNIFLATEAVQIPVRSGGDRIAWTVTDFRHAKAAEGAVTPKDGRAVIEPGIKRPGYFEIDLVVEKGGARAAEGKTSFAVITPIDVAAMHGSPFGVMTHFAQGWDLDVMPLIAKAGIVTIRDEQYWAQVEKKQGEFVFPDRMQAYMAEAAKFHIEPLVVMTFENKLYDEGLTPYTPEGCKAYGRYGQAILQEYGPQIRWLEIWNEYNGTWCKGPAKEDRPKFYAQMLKYAFEAIREKRPDVKVIGGAAVLMPLPWFEGIFKNGGLDYMDAVVIHPYRGAPEGVDTELAELRDLIKKYNKGALKPIWVTETGHYDHGEDGRTNVAKYLVRMYTLLLSERVERIYWYLVRDYQNFKTMGLVRDDKDPWGRYAVAPPYVAYANLIRQLHGAEFVRREPTDRWTRIYLFKKGGDEIRICWAVLPTTVTLKASGPLTAIDMMGGEERMEPPAAGAPLTLSETPVYIKGAVTGISQPPSPIIADSAEDYSNEQGKAGWFYGYYDGSGKGKGDGAPPSGPYTDDDFQMLKYSETVWGYVWTGPQKYLKLSRDNGHPEVADGKPVWAVRRWQSGAAGRLKVSGKVSRPDKKGDGTKAVILVDGTVVFEKMVGGPDKPPSLDFETVMTVKQGSLVDFAITPGPGTDTGYDATNFTVRIECSPG
jgi:hypothetical protein